VTGSRPSLRLAESFVEQPERRGEHRLRGLHRGHVGLVGLRLGDQVGHFRDRADVRQFDVALSVGFGGELTEAISSLEQTQDSAASASQALAAGTASDPESAVVTVEDAQLAMELASQIRTKATEATQNIFQTQV
jgi:flagellar hook-basal body complex protein FliE